MTLSTPALAAALGISRQRVNELGRKGKITREPNGEWNPDKVRAALGRNLDIRQASPARGEAEPKTIGRRPSDPPISGRPPIQTPRRDASSPEKGTLAHAQLMHEQAKAAKAAMEAQRLEGKLIDRKTVEAEWCDIAAHVQAAVMSLPGRIANRLPAEWKRDVLAAAQDEGRHVLTALSNEIRSGSKAA